MRISEYEKSNIRHRILDDLYEKTFEELLKRQRKVAKDAFNYALEPYLETLTALPAGLVPRVQAAVVHIKYTSPIEVHPEFDKVNEDWRYGFNTPQIGFAQTEPYEYGRVTPAAVTLDPRQYEETAELLDELIAIRSEKAKLKKYLHETMSTFSGSLQLKKVWPTTLHKYLPPEPVKTPKAATAKPVKKEAPAPVVAPIDLKARLTTNLLEDS